MYLYNQILENLCKYIFLLTKKGGSSKPETAGEEKQENTFPY